MDFPLCIGSQGQELGSVLMKFEVRNIELILDRPNLPMFFEVCITVMIVNIALFMSTSFQC